ncbi:hypothetical protein MPSEU_000447800 [Mayamaea pseudoterrestris]|nr:hypothetical protein MPSEU_000447800 [Mayamaea pseudoterrestris]
MSLDTDITMTDPSLSVAHMSNLLHALTQPDTNTIRQAEAALKPILKNPASMMVLWQIIKESQDVAVRHVAAIVLRKRLPSHYATADAAMQLEWQSQVLQQLAIEQVRPVRSGLVGVAAALAQVAQDPSPPYLQFLAAAVSSREESARELCFLLLSEMTETVGMHWKSHLGDLQQLFATTLNSNTESMMVQKAAVQAAGQLLSYWADEEDELSALAPLLPTILQIASTHTQDEDFLSTVLDVMYDLAYSPAKALVPHMAMTVEFSLQCIQNRGLELRVRDSAALVIATTAEAKSKAFGRNTELLGKVLDTLFMLMQLSSDSAAGALFESNPAWKQDLDGEHHQHHDDGDDDDMDSPTETSMAQGTLDMIACELPKKLIWQQVLQRCVERMQSPDPSARKAGVAGLGVIAEGCSEPLTAALANVMPLVFGAAQDPDAQVRECACFCLGQISEHCQPDVLGYSEQILPIVFQLLDDKSIAVQVTSCYVLEMFCERLDPTAVRPLLDPLVRKLAAMLEATTKRSVQEMTVAALAATAVAAEEEFAPYVQGVANLMTTLMQITDSNLHSLRGRALECMGHMAIAVGRDHFRPYFTPTMQCAFGGLQMNSTELQEFSYAVFANLAKVMMEEFAPALPELVPHLVKVLEEDEGQLVPGEGEEEFGGLDDSDDEDEEGQYVLHVRTALLDVKKGAITALGEMASHTGTSFCPYLEQCMGVLQTSAANWHPLIKSEVADAFPSMIVPSIAAYHNGEIQYTKGDLNSPNTLSQHTTALVGAVLTEEIGLMNDDDKNVVAKACEGVQSVVELCGPHALAPVAEQLMQIIYALLNKQAPCYGEDAMFGELPDDDDDHDTVTQGACDLIGGICRVMGQHFVPYLPQFLPAICEYGKSSRPTSDRSMSIGCLSEIAQELEGGILEYWPSVFRPAILTSLADSDDNAKRNASFCAGMCAEHLREQIAGDYPAILERLGPIFALDPDASDSTAACIDNAAAAISRMIMACPTHVPLDQALPVFLRVLPLKTDMTENETVYKCLLGLIQMNHGAVAANRAELKRIFTAACQEDSKVDDEIKGKLRAALLSLG